MSLWLVVFTVRTSLCVTLVSSAYSEHFTVVSSTYSEHVTQVSGAYSEHITIYHCGWQYLQ